tara:strand:- start:44428 stop:45240 length:813 start_codon:yes stop_codon:yes gene_type:complete
MKKALSLVVLTQAFLFLSGCSSLFMKSDPLTLNLEQGSSHSLKNETHIQYFTDATLSEEVMTMKMTMMVDYSVTKVEEDGSLALDAKVSSVKLKQNMQGMGIAYDSENADSTNEMGAMVAQQLEPILNQIVNMNIDKFGEVIKDENKEEAAPGANPENLIGQSFSKLPACELKVGETWTQELDSTSNVPAPLVYTVESVDKEKVTFTYAVDKSQIKEKDKDADFQSGGKATYDRKTGKIISTTNNSTMKGTNPQMGDFFLVSTTTVSSVK